MGERGEKRPESDIARRIGWREEVRCGQVADVEGGMEKEKRARLQPSNFRFAPPPGARLKWS